MHRLAEERCQNVVRAPQDIVAAPQPPEPGREVLDMHGVKASGQGEAHDELAHAGGA